MENKIKLLTPDLINKIAAGEVVERPASIVKELLENALDAKASEIILQLEQGGIDSISVIDNGSGMNTLEAESALQQHATSKITTEEDLYNIYTLGFRGEALASIASVSEVVIHSYDGKNPPVLATASATGIISKQGQGRAQGTTVTANKIFQKIPARRKFLKTEATEYRYILEIFQQIALINPTISFKLFKNGKQSLHYLKADDFRARILQVFPQLSTSDLVPVYYDSSELKLEGFIGHPSTGSRNLVQQFIFINKRHIKNNLIAKAVKEGYATALMREEQPLFLLNLNISPKLVDVNVHPRKLEVRFSEPGQIFSMIKKSVNTALNKELQQKFQENFANEIKTPKQNKPVASKTNSIQQSLEFSATLLTGETKFSNFPKISPSVNNQYNRADAVINDFTESLQPAKPTTVLENNNYLQVFDTYIVIPKDDKVLFIDQHAAHERINFERISNELDQSESLATQELLIPEKLTFSTHELALLQENLEIMKRIGFSFNDFQTNSCNLTAIPSLIESKSLKSIFSEVFDDIKKSDGSDFSARWRTIKDKLIGTLACHASIKAGDKLQPAMVLRLINDLFACNLPYSCPHGRPIIFELNKFQLEKNFKRKI